MINTLFFLVNVDTNFFLCNCARVLLETLKYIKSDEPDSIY